MTVSSLTFLAEGRSNSVHDLMRFRRNLFHQSSWRKSPQASQACNSCHPMHASSPSKPKWADSSSILNRQQIRNARCWVNLYACSSADSKSALRHMLRYMESTLHSRLFFRPGTRYMYMGTQMLSVLVASKIGGLLEISSFSLGVLLSIGSERSSW